MGALVILNGTTVKLTILYPATTGRNFDEVLRTLVSLQLTAGNGLATPVDWRYGERVIVGPIVKTEDAKAKFEHFQIKDLPSGKPYLRSVQCPPVTIPRVGHYQRLYRQIRKWCFGHGRVCNTIQKK